MADSAFRKRPKTSGHDDMVMLSKAGNQEIHDNLNMRYKNDIIYTYIGEVLIAVNPFKSIPIYNDSKIDEYNGVQMSENPPHIYAIGDDMYRNLLIDHEDQCVIISGESGAGKTVNAKFIMEYLSKVSGGIGDIERVKKIIMSTNPLLEAFGNAKTLRNNNSSRFGKYFTINFDQGGQPVGGSISNFLLEKTRVSGIQPGERNFHIFYMLISGLKNKGVASDFGLGSGAESFRYTSMSGEYHADGIDDVSEFVEMEQALKIINLSQEKINQIYSILSGVLYLGNIEFQENSSGWAEIVDNGAIENAASLLNVDSASLSKCLLTCKVRMVNEVISKTFNAFQANQARDSLAQGIYTRMFDNFVLQINDTLKVPNVSTKSCGVLDIYGFEIFDNNGFEQLCINFVNEKLQQIFIELTLKSEQEEYKREQIQWTDIKYLNNKEICDVIEMKLPKPGIFYLMNDVSKSANAMDPGKVDKQILGIIVKNLTGRIIGAAGEGAFTIQHYAGQVTYNVSGFFEKNRDVQKIIKLTNLSN